MIFKVFLFFVLFCCFLFYIRYCCEPQRCCSSLLIIVELNQTIYAVGSFPKTRKIASYFFFGSRKYKLQFVMQTGLDKKSEPVFSLRFGLKHQFLIHIAYVA